MRDGIKDQWMGTQEADTSKGDGRETRTDGRRSEKVRFEDVAVDEPMFLTGDERAARVYILVEHSVASGASALWR